MTEAITNDKLIEQFNATFGQSNEVLHHFYAPGRVNLIGEYTDFNGGLVLPCGIERGIHLLVRFGAGDSGNKQRGNQQAGSRKSQSHAAFVSANLPQRATVNLAEPLVRTGNQWTNYPLGVFQEFINLECPLQDMQLYYYGDVPDGAGLSSSAAIEVVTACALDTLYSMHLSTTELALLSQRAENNFIGVQCGIMDQFAVANAMADRAMALNCNTLDCEQVPLKSADYRILISNTGQRRELAGGAYNERVRECNQALELLKPATGANQLADISPQVLHDNIDLLPDPLIRKRASHVIEEHNRVMLATDMLKNNDLAGFGRLMVDSHQSLKDNFNVSSTPLDTMVELTLQVQGVLGSRMTGAGFGGCTVTLLHKDAIDELIETITPAYTNAINLVPEFYSTRAAAGVREIIA